MSLSSRKENDLLFLNHIKKIYTEREQLESSSEQFPILTEKLYQIWMKPQLLSNIHNAGYSVVDYLEELLAQNQFHDDYFSLVINTLTKNEYFYQSLLDDEKRFARLFNSSSMKTVYLLRYVHLLYCHCPMNLISTVGMKFYRFVMEKSSNLKQLDDIDTLAVFSSFISQFYENSRKNSMKMELIFLDPKEAINHSIHTIDTLLHHRLNLKVNKDLNHDIQSIKTITKAIGVVWEQYSTKENQEGSVSVPMRSIEYFFDTLSTEKSSIDHFQSPAILPLFPHIQLDLADTTLKSMFADGRLNGERLSIMIRTLIEFIDAPTQLLQHMSYETWITGLCNAFVTFHQHEYLKSIIDQTTIFFIDHLFDSQTAENAFRILFWFILYDKRVETFRHLLDRLANLFEQFQKTHTEDLRTRTIELCHMAVVIHPEFDISNEIILKQILNNFPQPDLNILANHRKAHARFHSIISENEKNIPNRLGIINLGNTCYVSSVLQALYQCDLFRKYILECRFNEQIILSELQIIFAQLYLSKRPHVNAINLVKIARPPWFTINEQQDCAEFLGYLLDAIKDEEKKDGKLSLYEIERLFTIRTRQINRCQRCSNESFSEESSNYLFLPIPTVDHPSVKKNFNQSAIPISMMKNGLRFYAASNGNSISNEQTNMLVPSNSSIQPPPSSNNPIDQSLNLQFVFDCCFQKEELKDDNQYRCEHCRSLQNAERYIILRTAPEYLILSLNRFEYEKTTNTFRKIFTKINYPKILHVPIHPSGNSIATKYCLVLVIVHSGYTLHGGHYYVYAREVKPCVLKSNIHEQEDYFSDDQWLLLNDDLVTVSSYEAMIENCAQYTSATPYILFYKRIDEQRMEEIERTKQIHVRKDLGEQIHDDNMLYEREQEK